MGESAVLNGVIITPEQQEREQRIWQQKHGFATASELIEWGFDEQAIQECLAKQDRAVYRARKIPGVSRRPN